MHQETPEELFSGDSYFFPLSMIFIIFCGKDNGVVRYSFDPVVAYCDSVGIFSQVPDYGFSAVKGLFTIRNPFLTVTGIYKLLENITISIGLSCSMKLKLIVFPQLLQLRQIFAAEQT